LNVINTVLGVHLGFIIYFAYHVTGNYGFAILVFAVAIKIVLFPVNILAHKNSIRFLKLQPSLNRIKRRYSGDRERINEEQYSLFQKEKYNPFIGIILLFIQLCLVIGMLQVMYHPLQHMLHLDKRVIDALIQVARNLSGIHGGGGEQLMAIKAIQRPENISMFQSALAGFPDGKITLQLLEHIGLNFFNLNLSDVPSFIKPSLVLLIPLFSGTTSLIFCLVQNVFSPGALGQSKGTKLGFTIFTVTFSFYFTFVTPVGVGMYWTAGNILGIAVLLILNILYPPPHKTCEALEETKALRKTPARLREERKRNKALSIREKIDAARFCTAKKQLVFYALTGGQYKYYAEIIEYITQYSDIQIHYLTNDPDDAVFRLNNECLIPYYASQKKTISLMLKLDADLVVTTIPDLQKYHIKRSIVHENLEYIYVFHGFTSLHMVMRSGTLDYYDTVFCVGPHHLREIRRSEELYNTTKKRLVKVGYGVFDRLFVRYGNEQKHDEATKILIAPSWQVDNIMELCIDNVLDQLIGRGYRIIVRPHPQYINAFGDELKKLQERYAKNVCHEEIFFELDFMESPSMYLSDLLITDWSNTAYEFAFCTKKPVLFINTPMKILNPNYADFNMEPSDIYLRNKVGVSIDVNNLDELGNLVAKILKDGGAYREKISKTVDEFLYYPMRSGQAGGKYILSRLC
jgi:YidC/Oxa1 family membrane protein insertase